MQELRSSNRGAGSPVVQPRVLVLRRAVHPAAGPATAHPGAVPGAGTSSRPGSSTGTTSSSCARRLKSRHDAGDVLNANQIRCYKNALGLHPGGAQL